MLVILLTAPALQALWQTGLQQTDDGMHHLFRLFNLDLALRAGHPGARWLAGEGFGYGFPVLNFYAPLGYYAGLIFHWLGAGFATTLELALATGLLLSALAMYAFARKLLGPWGGAAAAVAYTWAPYHLADAWTRGALAELLAFIWLPLLLLALWRSAESHAGLAPVLWGGAALGGLALTHNLTLLLALPVLTAWALLLLAVEAPSWPERRRRLAGYGLLALLGMALSAIFWLPALAEAEHIWAGHVATDFDAWAGQLVSPPKLLAETWAQRYTVAQQIGKLHPLGQAQLALAGLGLATGLWRWRRLERTARLALPLFLGLALLALFLQTTWSRPLWQAMPGLLLLQFPWRWQMISALALALVSGYVVYAIPGPAHEASQAAASGASGLWLRIGPPLALLLMALALMSGALPSLPWQPANIPTTETPVTDQNVNRRSMALYDFGRGLWLREHGSAWMFEYMPVWVQTPRSEFFLTAGPSATGGEPLAASVILGRQAPLEQRFQVAAPAPWRLQLHQFHFPGWQALVDGQAQPSEPAGPLGLASVQLPAGEHEVVFRFGLTPARRLGWVLTAAGAVFWLAGTLWLRRWRWLAALAVAALIFAGLALQQRQANPADYAPAPVAANFGNEAQLVAFQAPPEQLNPDGASTVVLHWLALRRPAIDYKVFVHLVDSSGQLWAQHDGEPGFFFSPTTRWQQGELIPDHHVLEWRGPPPPGRYRLYVGLYDPATGDRLPIIGPDGAPGDNRALLAEFDQDS